MNVNEMLIRGLQYHGLRLRSYHQNQIFRYLNILNQITSQRFTPLSPPASSDWPIYGRLVIYAHASVLFYQQPYDDGVIESPRCRGVSFILHMQYLGP
ncbi:hypothetical protein EYC84_006495 [Monilinia fructicola]|uniref:Uncharacterized protein n=1 Tax=Monilinia fructicola TaxID=38448 RepID=A0A5M9K774_MONFR|nr:hypothetical protein EYC84_006495 [Monilinia fructicola]